MAQDSHNSDNLGASDKAHFDIGAGGGTHFAPAMEEAWRTMMEQPSTVGKSDWDRYLLHFTDGEPQIAEGDSLLALLERLRGTPSGYVGYTEGGLLDGFFVGHEGARTVILLDEVEPAHEFKKD